MRFAALVVILFCFTHAFSNGQTVPGLGTRNTKELPPIVIVRPEIEPESPNTNHKQLLAEVQELITEAQTLQQELNAAPGSTVSLQSIKRSQRIERLSKKIRKTLKLH